MALHRRDHAAGFVPADFRVVVKAGSHPLNFIHVFDERLATFLCQERSEVALILAHLARDAVQ